MNSIKVGRTYKMSDIDVVCVGYSKKGFAKMQTLGMTAGRWSGEGNISDYNDITRRFANEWKGIIKKFRLPTLEKAKVNKDIRTALAKAAENCGSFGAGNDYAWLGTVNGSNNAWYVYTNSHVYSNSDQDNSCVVAPAFNLNISKVILDGDRIKKADIEAESEE